MRSIPKLADQEPGYVWTYRVLGTGANGSVTGSEVVESDDALEAAHDRIMALPGTRMAETMGPFRDRRIATP